MTLARGTVEQLLRVLEPGLDRLPDEPTLSLLLELVLAPLLGALEAVVGARMTLSETRSSADRDPAPGAPGFGFHGTLEGIAWRAVLWADRESGAAEPLVRIARAIERAVPLVPRALDGLPVPLEFRAGTMRLRWSTLSDVRPGDVLVPDAFPLAQGEVEVAAGGLRARAVVQGAALQLQSPFSIHPARTESPMSDIGDFATPLGTAPDRTRPNGSADLAVTPPETTLGSLEVTLAFELGRCQIDLARLQSIAPGYVFPLAIDAAGPVEILANGRRIGRGEIVRVGETLGVRATRLFGHE
jgi:type III secretion protein Q